MRVGRDLIGIAILVAVISALGLVPGVTLPFAGGVPIAVQSMGIMLSGVVLGPLAGTLAVLVFLGFVALGAPLLTGGRGGTEVFFGPSAGFLVGFPIAAFVTGWIMRGMSGWSVFGTALLASSVGGILVLYAMGIPGMALVGDLPLGTAVFGAIAYLPGDVIKAFGVAAIAQALAHGRPRALLSRA